MNYTHPKIAARIRAYLRRDTDHTPTGILRGVHKQASRIHTTLRELEANGEIYRHLSPQPGPPDTWHLTDTTHDTNPGTNATTPTETQPEQPLEGWLTEVNTGDIHPREAARLLDELFTRVATQPGWPGVSATLKLLGDCPCPSYRRVGQDASDEGENRATLCRCGHPSTVHEQGTPGRCSRCGCDRFGRPADLEHEDLSAALITGELHIGASTIPGADPAPRLVVTRPWTDRRVEISEEHGIRVASTDGEIFHMPAAGGFHRDIAGKPCKSDVMVLALGDHLETLEAGASNLALDVVAWLADQGLLADPPERA